MNLLGAVALLVMCAWAMSIASSVMTVVGVHSPAIAWGALGMSWFAFVGLAVVIWGMSGE